MKISEKYIHQENRKFYTNAVVVEGDGKHILVSRDEKPKIGDEVRNLDSKITYRFTEFHLESVTKYPDLLSINKKVLSFSCNLPSR